MRKTSTVSVNGRECRAVAVRSVGESRRRGRGSLAPSLLRGSAPVAGRCPPRRCPAPGRSTSHRNAPWVTRSASWPGRSSRVRCADRRMKGHSAGPERRAVSGLAPPASRALPTVASPRRRAQAPALDPGVSASPAGLTARARPEARPDTRAANLSRSGNTYRRNGETRSRSGPKPRQPVRMT